MSLQIRFGWYELTIALSCILLAGLGWAFERFTPGLVDKDGTYVRTYNSTGSDDDLCILVSTLIFFLCFAAVGWLPSLGRLDFVKGGVFTLAWLFQLGWLGWIEVGSIGATIRLDRNVVLLVWMLVFGVSPILVWMMTLKKLVALFSKESG